MLPCMQCMNYGVPITIKLLGTLEDELAGEFSRYKPYVGHAEVTCLQEWMLIQMQGGFVASNSDVSLGIISVEIKKLPCSMDRCLIKVNFLHGMCI